jgi:beta-mannosidase
VSTAFHLPGGLARPPEVDLGLRATARREDDGPWLLTVSTDRFAQWVRIDVPGFRPTDSWFHLAPGESRRVVLNTESRLPDSRPPRGQVAALNLLSPMPIQVE